MKDYQEFLKSKVVITPKTGFDITDNEIHPKLKPHQKAIVRWMVEGGRRACFAAFGLGKTIIQIEAVRLTRKYASGMGLIVIPLGVRQEFVRDGAMLGVSLKFIRRIEEATNPEGIYLTNYETIRDGKMDPRLFSVTSLDEASCLRGFGGTKTFREFMRLFAGDGKTLNKRIRSEGVRYRYVATATPSPNEFIELLAYSAYLDIMDVSAAKTRFFKRDSTKADSLTIHPHKEHEFWLWCASWGIFVQKPSDLGFSDEGYVLPELDVRWHKIGIDHAQAGCEKDGQGRMFRDAAIGVQDAAKEKRLSLDARIEKLMEILNENRQDIPQELLYEESGTITQRAKGARKQKGSRKDASISESILSCEQGTFADNTTGTPAEALPSEQRKTQNSQSQGDSQEVWFDPGPISGHSGRAGRRMCNLHAEHQDSQNGSGSLSQNRSSQGDPVQLLQHSAGLVRRLSGTAHGSSGLSDQVIIWCDLNDEQRRIEKELNKINVSFSSLSGNQDVEKRMELLESWRNKEASAFISKPMMYGSGVNLQQCHTMIFIGIGFKFQDIIQAIHRIHRFLQTQPCTVHLIYTEAEDKIRKQLERKWSQHKEMVRKMTDIIREFGLSEAAMAHNLTRSLGIERVEISGESYKIINNDSVLETASMEENSVGLILTSIPFSTQYEYSPNYADFGHTDNNAHFFEQMDFLTPNLFKVLQPGRIAAIHVKDRIVPGGMTGLGFQTVYPFHARCIEHYTKHGFAYMGMKTIVTDVVRENNQTYRLGWTEQCKDGSKMGVGMPEYLLLFRKPPTDTINSYADKPVVKSKERYSRARWQIDAHGFARSSGDRHLRPEELECLTHEQIYKAFKAFSLEQVYDYEHHVKIGEHLDNLKMLPVTFMLLPPQSWSDEVWTDITRMLTLNGAQSAKGKEMHLCPMQFDLADRVIEQFSMPGEVVFDPFGGLMTVPYRAILKGRYGMGCELSPRYFLDGAYYCKAAEKEVSMPTLFDFLKAE